MLLSALFYNLNDPVMPRFFHILLMCALFAHTQIGLAKDSMTIAVASNFKTTLEQLVIQFEREHDLDITVVSAATMVLFNQINYGAPFDIFLSADQKHVELLEQNNKAIKGAGFTYAIGQLALASSNASVNNLSQRELSKLLKESSGRIAIAKPELAPYGIAAMQALEYINLWKPLQRQLVKAQNVNQSYQWFYSGTVEYAFIATSQLKLQPIDFYLTIPANWYQPIKQQAALLAPAADNPNAKLFLAFLQSSKARDIISQHGYLVPGASAEAS